MEYNKRILVGSSVFFSDMEGFKPKDRDYVVFVEKGNGYKHSKEVLMGDTDLFYVVYRSKEDLLNWSLSKSPILLGKFLVPQIIEAVGITIDDIKAMDFMTVDEKHQYQKIIADAYIENNSFSLTEEQLQCAYNNYLNSRK